MKINSRLKAGALPIIIVTLLCSGVNVGAGETTSNLGCLTESPIYIDSIPHPKWRNHSVYLFRPNSSKTRVPVVLFCHGIGANRPSVYDGLINHIVKQGSAVIYAPFVTSLTKPNRCYTMMWSGFTSGIEKWGAGLDTTRVGFVGHSYGGGAVPGIAHKALYERHWGSNASFLYIMAPWFSYWLTQVQLQSFPSTTRLIMQIFRDDKVNDPRMALDIYDNINIPNGHKWFVFTDNDTCETGILRATHSLPEGKCAYGASFDTLCYFGFSRVVDALTSHLGTGVSRDLTQTFGNDITTYLRQAECFTSVNSAKHLSQSATLFVKPEISYINFWHHLMNPRIAPQRDTNSHNGTNRIRSRTTISNYLWFLFYPASLRAQEEDLRDSSVQWDEDIEYRDTAVYTRMTQERKGRYQCAPGPIESGCGARGPFGVMSKYIPNSAKGNGKMYLFIPQAAEGPFPIIYFTPTAMNSSHKYRELLFNLASQGYIVVASTNNDLWGNDEKRSIALQNEFEMCNVLLNGLIDTSRVGFVAHALGTAPLVSTAGWYLSKKNWGNKGSFIFLMAPNYSRKTRAADMKNIPSHVWIGIQMFNEHTVREERFAHWLFNGFPVVDSQKTLMLVNGFTDGVYEAEADRKTPRCEEWDDDLNCIVEYGIFRPLGAIAQHAFKPEAKDKCFDGIFRDAPEYQVEFNGMKWRPTTSLYGNE